MAYKHKNTEAGINLSALATETTRKGEILGLNRDTLGMDSREVSILEEGHKIGLSSLLECHDGGRLEAEIGLKGCSISSVVVIDVADKLTLKSCAISRTRRWKGSLRIRSSVDFW